MELAFKREIGLISELQYEKLKSSLVIIFGLGGVGGYTFEMLVRSGVSNFILIDKDKFDVSNFNRQLAAIESTINKSKVEVYKDRGISINRNSRIIAINEIVDTNNINIIFANISKFNNINTIYVIDCIDDFDAKIAIIKYCYINNIKVISSMGTANHLSTENIKISDIKMTRYCPIAKKIRKNLKELSIKKLDCLFIDEEPIRFNMQNYNSHTSTISYVPATCGIKIAEYVIKKII